MSSYLSLPGSSGNYASTPDAAPLDILGDIDIRVFCAPADWTPAAAQTMTSKYNGYQNQKSWFFRFLDTGELQLLWSTDGSIPTFGTSTAATGFANATAHWVRVTLDVDNGASGYDLEFYTSENGIDWTQLGTTIVGGATTSIFNSTTALRIGDLLDAAGDSAGSFAGRIYRVQIYSGIAGTLEFDANFAAEQPGTTSFAESSVNAATVTIGQSGSPQAEIVEDPADPWSTEGWGQLVTVRDIRGFGVRGRPVKVERGHTESATPTDDTTE